MVTWSTSPSMSTFTIRACEMVTSVRSTSRNCAPLRSTPQNTAALRSLPSNSSAITSSVRTTPRCWQRTCIPCPAVAAVRRRRRPDQASRLRTMILAELEVFHSRAYSPTRRIALGHRVLPVDPPPGFGPLLLGGIVAVGAEEIDADDYDALLVLMAQL